MMEIRGDYQVNSVQGVKRGSSGGVTRERTEQEGGKESGVGHGGGGRSSADTMNLSRGAQILMAQSEGVATMSSEVEYDYEYADEYAEEYDDYDGEYGVDDYEDYDEEYDVEGDYEDDYAVDGDELDVDEEDLEVDGDELDVEDELEVEEEVLVDDRVCVNGYYCPKSEVDLLAMKYAMLDIQIAAMGISSESLFDYIGDDTVTAKMSEWFSDTSYTDYFTDTEDTTSSTLSDLLEALLGGTSTDSTESTEETESSGDSTETSDDSTETADEE